MTSVDVCPFNLVEVEEASKRLGCGNDSYGNNQYMCLPNVNKTALVEFCYDGIMGLQEKGTWYNVECNQQFTHFVFDLVIGTYMRNPNRVSASKCKSSAFVPS